MWKTNRMRCPMCQNFNAFKQYEESEKQNFMVCPDCDYRIPMWRYRREIQKVDSNN